MFDWNGNGRIDTDDHAFTAFLIDEMNRKDERDNSAKPGFLDDDDDTIDYGGDDDDYE